MIEGTELENAVLERLAESSCCDSYCLRGSLLTRLWVGSERRSAQDIDLLADYPYNPRRTREELTSALSARPTTGDVFEHPPQFQSTWVDSEFPGLKMTLTAVGSRQTLQVDIGYGDPVVAELARFQLGNGHRIRAVAPEVMFGWKLHGLWESDGWWRPKDLTDLWLLKTHVALDPETLRAAISEAFSSRQTPLWKLRRLLTRDMGQSAGSQRRWRVLLRSAVVREVPRELSQVIADLADFLGVITASMELGYRPIWVVGPTQNDCQALIATSKDFRRYPWQGSAATYVYERANRETFPQPFTAPTSDECRQRLVRWECRGLTLDGANVLARPFPRLFSDRELKESAANGAQVTLKLDGSLIFPTCLSAQSPHWRWRTRRGVSQISEDAGYFAQNSSSDYCGLVELCLAAGLTPLFEWCSRRRLLILDQPVDRLVLTGLRENVSGLLRPWADVDNLGRQFEVEVTPFLGTIGVDFDLNELRSWIGEWRDREGVVALTSENRLYKLKSPHYRMLHGAIEGPAYDISRWRLILNGEEQALLAAASRRNIDLHHYVANAHVLLARVAEAIRGWCRTYQDDRGDFAQRLPLTGLAKHWTFCALDGAELEPMIRRDLRQALNRRGNRQALIEQLQEWQGSGPK